MVEYLKGNTAPDLMTGVEQSGLPSKKYLDQMIGLITTINNYSTTAVSLLQLCRTSDCRHNSNKSVLSNLLSRIVIILYTSLT
jgi:hypothetical protein